MPSARAWPRPNGPFMIGPSRCCILPTRRRSYQTLKIVQTSRTTNSTTTLIRTSHHGSFIPGLPSSVRPRRRTPDPSSPERASRASWSAPRPCRRPCLASPPPAGCTSLPPRVTASSAHPVRPSCSAERGADPGDGPAWRWRPAPFPVLSAGHRRSAVARWRGRPRRPDSPPPDGQARRPSGRRPARARRPVPRLRVRSSSASAGLRRPDTQRPAERVSQRRQHTKVGHRRVRCLDHACSRVRGGAPSSGKCPSCSSISDDREHHVGTLGDFGERGSPG